MHMCWEIYTISQVQNEPSIQICILSLKLSLSRWRGIIIILFDLWGTHTHFCPSLYKELSRVVPCSVERPKGGLRMVWHEALIILPGHWHSDPILPDDSSVMSPSGCWGLKEQSSACLWCFPAACWGWVLPPSPCSLDPLLHSLRQAAANISIGEQQHLTTFELRGNDRLTFHGSFLRPRTFFRHPERPSKLSGFLSPSWLKPWSLLKHSWGTWAGQDPRTSATVLSCQLSEGLKGDESPAVGDKNMSLKQCPCDNTKKETILLMAF